MKRSSLLLLLATLSGLVGLQFADSQPTPTPSQWQSSGNTISYSRGGVDVPSTVAGGSKGAGTINATRLYYGGALVPPYSSFVAGYAKTINCNAVNTDTAIALVLPTANYELVQVTLVHATGTAGSATLALFSGPSASGTQLAQTTAVPSGTAPDTTTVAVHMNLNTVAQSAFFDYTTIYARVVAASGSACAANIYVQVRPLP